MKETFSQVFGTEISTEQYEYLRRGMLLETSLVSGGNRASTLSQIQCPIGEIPSRVSDGVLTTYTIALCSKPALVRASLSQPMPGPGGQICGGARLAGWTNRDTAFSCQPGFDGTCDRWGCALLSDPATGMSDCPAWTRRVSTSDSPTYFVCVVDSPLPVIPSIRFPGKRVMDVCGGSRMAGKVDFAPQGDDCQAHSTQDNSCDRWGCAVMYDAVQGRSDCPAGTRQIRTSDDFSYFLCQIVE